MVSHGRSGERRVANKRTPLEPNSPVSQQFGRGLVARPRLSARLDETPRLTVVRAPLGFGKTVLVAQWMAGARDELAVFLAVDSESADSNSFWRRVLEGLANAGLDGAIGERDLSDRDQVRRAVAAPDREVTLVVDGFDRISDDRLEGELYDLLQASPGLRLVGCSRNNRQFSLPERRAMDATVVSANDLLLTMDETAKLLHETGLEVTDNTALAKCMLSGGLDSGEAGDHRVVLNISFRCDSGEACSTHRSSQSVYSDLTSSLD
jgi:LuxR family maltose regulon positive regulatory protein